MEAAGNIDRRATRRDRKAHRKAQRQREKRKLAGAKRASRVRIAKTVAVVVILAALLACALVVGDGSYRATAIGWVPLLTAVFAIILAAIYIQVLKRSLRFSDASAAQDCERGADVRFSVEFVNTAPVFFFRIEAFFFVSDLFGNKAKEASTTLALGPRESYELGFSSVFEHIGQYTAGLDRVVISDFLGLFTATLENDVHRQVTVLPAVQHIEALRFSNEAIIETTKAARGVLADSMDYAQVREYEQGDPLKTIHWKLSAHSSSYMTRLYEIQTNPGVVVLIDFYGPSNDAETLMGMFDAVVECAFSVAQYARERGMDVEVVFREKSGARRRVVGWKRDDRANLLGAMRNMTNDIAEEAETISMLRDEIISPTAQSNIVLCSASMDPTMLSTLVDAQARHKAPILVSVVPRDVIERDRDSYTKPLARLDDAGVPYIVLDDSSQLAGVVA